MDRLSPKQRAIIAHVSDGWTNDEIAREYGSTRSAVATDISRIMAFLHAKNRAHIVGIALRNRIIQ